MSKNQASSVLELYCRKSCSLKTQRCLCKARCVATDESEWTRCENLKQHKRKHCLVSWMYSWEHVYRKYLLLRCKTLQSLWRFKWLDFVNFYFQWACWFDYCACESLHVNILSFVNEAWYREDYFELLSFMAFDIYVDLFWYLLGCMR